MKFTLTIETCDIDDIYSIINKTNGVPVLNIPEAPEYSEAPSVFDSAGIPWDDRIHSSTKAVTEAGLWRKRRGIDPATVAEIEILLTNVSVVEDTPEMPTTPSIMMPEMPVTPMPEMPVAPMPEMPVAPITEMPVAPITFNDFMQGVSRGMSAKIINPAYLKELSETFGLSAITDLITNESLIPSLIFDMEKAGKWVK